MNARLFDDAPNYASACFPAPRDFQNSAHEALRVGFREGHRCQMVMAPTGAGKSYLGLRVAHEALLRGRKVTFVCDRTTLINQTSKTADSYGLGAHGIYQADHWRTDRDMPLQIASAQTIASRGWPDSDIVVIDEAHTQHAAWTKYIVDCKAAVIGLSATPFSPGLGKLFSRLINATTMHDLTQSGVLVPMRVKTCKRIDMTGAKVNRKGEWDDKVVAERGMGIVGDVVSAWAAESEGRKTIVFASTIDHCDELCRQFNAAGIMAATFTCDTNANDRKALLDEYEKPDSVLRVLISVEALAKGFDVKDVGCIIDCRPLRKSLSTAIQMWGRGLRSSPETGKKDCILLDHSGNILRFAKDFERIYYDGLDTLDAGEKLDKEVRDKDEEEKEEKACPECGRKPFYKRCISCGHELQRPALVVADAGVVQEIDILGKRFPGQDLANVWAQVATYAKTHSAPEKQQGRAYHLFTELTKRPPPPGWRVSSTPNVPLTREVLNHIKARTMAFVRAKQAAARRAA